MQASKLTAKQAKWVHEYLACGNATSSAIKAGFSPKGASVAGVRMLRNASVRRTLQARQTADATRLSITRESVLNSLLEAVNEARQQRNPAVMISGWREIGKMLGLYEPLEKRVKLTPAASVTMAQLGQMTDAELVRLIADGGGCV